MTTITHPPSSMSTATATPKSSHDLIADINYLPADGAVKPPETWTHRYLGFGDEHTRAMTIHDVRGHEDEFSLDANGFQFVTLPVRAREAADPELVKSEYYAELRELLHRLTGASTVHVFNHVVRDSSTPPNAAHEPKNRSIAIPAGHPHVDYCGEPSLLAGTIAELRLPPAVNAHFATCSRYMYVNVWRPLKRIERDPLAVADAASVPDADYQLRTRSFASGVKSGNYVLGHAARDEVHRWWYMSGMMPHEVVVFKGFDSAGEQAGRGWRCGHTAFVIPGTEALPPRESIESRAVCFFD